MSMKDKLRELSAMWRADADDPKFPDENMRDILEAEDRLLRLHADELDAILAEPVGEAVAYAYGCPAECGCLWRLFEDDDGQSLSLFGNSQPCRVCEPLDTSGLLPLYTTPPAPTADKAGVDDAAVERLAKHLRLKLGYSGLNKLAVMNKAREYLAAAAPPTLSQRTNTVDETLVQLVYKYIDRMNDVDPDVDPAERILAEFTNEVNAALSQPTSAPQQPSPVSGDALRYLGDTDAGIKLASMIKGDVLAGDFRQALADVINAALSHQQPTRGETP